MVFSSASHLGDFHFGSSGCLFQLMGPVFFNFFQKFLWFRFRDLPFMFSMFLPNLLHSRCALLSCYRWRMNKVSNVKIHRCTCSHCLTLNGGSVAGGLVFNWRTWIPPLLWTVHASPPCCKATGTPLFPVCQHVLMCSPLVCLVLQPALMFSLPFRATCRLALLCRLLAHPIVQPAGLSNGNTALHDCASMSDKLSVLFKTRHAKHT